MRNSDSCEEHTEVVLQIGHRADGGARIHRDRFLFNRNDRRQPINEIDIGFFELCDKAFGVSGHRLQESTLSFSVDGIKRQRGFTGTANPCDNDEFVSWDLNFNVL